jgi:hypothetical protein
MECFFSSTNAAIDFSAVSADREGEEEWTVAFACFFSSVFAPLYLQ